MGTTGKQIIPRERLDFAEKLYLAGKPRPEIARRICKRYDVTARTARRYLERVEAKLATLPRPPPGATFQRVEAMLLRAYDRADGAIKVVKWSEGAGEKKVEASRIFPAPETGTMVAAAWRLAELHGVTAPQRVELTGSDNGPLAIEVATTTPDALHARLAAIAARAVGGADPGAVGGADPGGKD